MSNEPMVVVNGEKYTIEQAIEMGILKRDVGSTTVNSSEEHEIEIIVDEETKSFRLQVNGGEGQDIPRELIVDAFQVSFKGVKTIVEDDGVDYETLIYLAKEMKMIWPLTGSFFMPKK